MKRKMRVATLDLAQRQLDEALMIEATETEAEEDPGKAKEAPYTTPVRRLDEVKATRKPVVRQALD
jgi:glycine dehydrogenase subunit 2